MSNNQVDFGNGKFSVAMEQFFYLANRFTDLSPMEAEKLARRYGADLGQFKTKDTGNGIKLSGGEKVTFRQSTTLTGINTPVVALGKQLAALEGVFGLGKVGKGIEVDYVSDCQELKGLAVSREIMGL